MFKKYFQSEKARLIFNESKTACFQYLKAQLILFGINSVVICIGLLLLGVGFWSVPIAIGTAIVDLLPVLGSGIVFVPWAIYEFCNDKPAFGGGLLLLFLALVIIKLILEPLVCGKKIGLKSGEALLSVVVGFLLFGGSGILLGPILAVIIKIVLKYTGNNYDGV